MVTFETIYQFFESDQPVHLNKELAACYVLSVLSRGDSYGTELIENLDTEIPNYRLSDTVLYTVLQFLEKEHVISGYWQKLQGRGRPRRMYQIQQDAVPEAQNCAKLWRDYTARCLQSHPEHIAVPS